MVSYNGKIYNCIQDTTANPLDESSWEEVKGYDLTFLFGDAITEGRRAVIYPYLGSENLLQTQYPDEFTIARCAIMNDFGEYNDEVVIMWSQVKAYTNMLPVYIFLSVVVVLFLTVVIISSIHKSISLKYKKRMMKK